VSAKSKKPQSGGCIVTPIAPASPPVAQFHIALLSVRQLAGILHANFAASLFDEVRSGRLPPMLAHPLRFRPFHPQGSALGRDWLEGRPSVAAL